MISDGCCATAVARAGKRARSGRDRLHQWVDAGLVRAVTPASPLSAQPFFRRFFIFGDFERTAKSGRPLILTPLFS
jgi:hypothetical protein